MTTRPTELRIDRRGTGEEAGRRYHAHALSGERRRADHGGAYWAGLALGLLLAVGSLAWIFRP